MEKESALYQLMGVRMNGVMNASQTVTGKNFIFFMESSKMTVILFS